MFNFCGTVEGNVTYRNFDSLAKAVAFGLANSESFDVEDNNGVQVYQEFPRTKWL